MQVKEKTKKETKESRTYQIVNTALKGVALAMGIAVVVLSVMDKIELGSAISMLGIGLAALAITQFLKQ